MSDSTEDPVAGARAVREAAGVWTPSYRGQVRVSGEAAGEVLECILSSSVKGLTPGRGGPSCLLTAKGRVVGAFDLWCAGAGEYRLWTRDVLQDGLVRTLGKYCLLSGVDVVDSSAERAFLAVQGPLAADVLASLLGDADLPSEGEWITVDIAGAEVQVCRGGETPEGGLELAVPAADIDGFRARLEDAAHAVGGGPVGPIAVEELRVEAGRARFGVDWDEESFPNAVGFESALTYDKCYVGQEIVARMRTYGEVNQRLRGLLLPAGKTVPAAGTKLMAGDEEAGTVTSAVLSSRLGCPIALARVGRRFWSEPELIVDVAGGDLRAKQVDLPPVRVDSSGDRD